ncbi:MAG: 2-C-methyl-D-erythritol 2,4-cyclodiphosphate synthase [Pseudomonadota bacterium]
MRVGQGFDAHRFADGDHVMLGGVKIPFDFGLAAHSDGDVILHAICDALLGAAGLGDIGQHFPDNDAQFAGADSRAFLRHCNGLVAAQGHQVANIDVTLIGERPRIGPFRDTIKANIAADLGIEPGAVNVKATTTEKMGFTGRGEGLAAAAVCLLMSR